MNEANFRLSRDTFGHLVLDIGGRLYGGVVPIRSFPISAPDQGIALLSPEGAELLWIDELEALPDDMRALLVEELACREFIPEIRRIQRVSSFATPSRWQVETDRGDTVLVLKGEEDIRRLSASALLIADTSGVQFLVRDIQALDKNSRRLLDHFL